MRDAESQNEPSDEALLNAIAGGAVWAMESLYQRYSRILYSLAYRMVADHQVAEDLLQDAFLAVWRRATSYSPQTGAARSWLISILHHRTIDYLQRTAQKAPLFLRLILTHMLQTEVKSKMSALKKGLQREPAFPDGSPAGRAIMAACQIATQACDLRPRSVPTVMVASE